MSSWVDKYFIDHPKTVDETYLQHMVVALSFALRLFWAGFACLLHALVPGMCLKTGSSMIDELYGEMVENRNRTQGQIDVVSSVPSSVAGPETAQ